MRISELKNYGSLKKLEEAHFDLTKSIDEQQELLIPMLWGLVGECAVIDTTPLCFAAEQGDIELITDLLNHGANVNACNYDGYSPLLLAIREGRAEAAKILIEFGADQSYSNKQNNRNKSAEYMLAEGRNTHGFFYTQYEKWIVGREINYDKTEKYLESVQINNSPK